MFAFPQNLPIPIMLIGGIMIGLGLVFVAQSGGSLGPSSSFMYNNVDWAPYGASVAIIGIIVFSIGLLMRLARSSQKRSLT